MNAILTSSILNGIVMGYIQGFMDPEKSKSFWKVVNSFTEELELSTVFGMYIGAATAVTIEIVRQIEVKHRKPLNDKGKGLDAQLDMQYAQYNNLNFEDDSEEYTPGGIAAFEAYEHRQSLGNNFNPLYDDDEERISLVNVAAPA